jgi:hypothetical protein
MRDLIICGDNSRNLIFYDPHLDRFSNCAFTARSLQKSSSVASIVGLGRSQITLAPGILFQGLRHLNMLDGSSSGINLLRR